MLLGVNIDHVATLRNARGGNEPDVLTAARINGIKLTFSSAAPAFKSAKALSTAA